MRRQLLRVVVLLVAAACDPFSAGSADDAGGTDAGSGGGTDGGLDATAVGEAGPDVFDASVSPCAGSHLFCDDFSGAALGALWSRRVEEAGLLSLDPLVFGLAAPSLKLAASAGLAGGTYLEKALPGAQRIVVGASVAVARADVPSGELDVLTLDVAVAGDPQRYMIAVVMLVDGTVVLRDRHGMAYGPLSIGSTMTRVVLDLDLDLGKVSLAAGGASIVVGTEKGMSQGQRLRIGVPYASNSAGNYVVNFDDVTVD